MWLSRLLNIFGEQDARILVLGLDNAGKTTILCELRGRGRRCAMPAGRQKAGRLPVAAGGRRFSVAAARRRAAELLMQDYEAMGTLLQGTWTADLDGL